jgi:tetratricopeptide (TPR) repeat protein
VLYKTGEYDEALAALQKAYEKLDDPEVASHIVEVLDAMDRRDEALTVLEAAESKDPDSAMLHDVRERIFPDAE